LTILVQRGAMGVSIDVLWGFACIAHTRVFFYSRRGVACPRARARVCVCVCDSHDRGPAKAAEPIEMPFGSRLPCMLRGVQITHGKGYFRGGGGHVPIRCLLKSSGRCGACGTRTKVSSYKGLCGGGGATCR